MNKRPTIDLKYLQTHGYTYITNFGYSEIWVKDKEGLLLDKIKENDKMYEVRFTYKRENEM